MTRKGLLIYQKGHIIYNGTRFMLNKTCLINSDLPFNYSTEKETYLFQKNHLYFQIIESNMTKKQLNSLNKIIWLDTNINPIFRNYLWTTGLILFNTAILCLVFIIFISIQKVIKRIKYIRISRKLNKTHTTPRKPLTLHYLSRLK